MKYLIALLLISIIGCSTTREMVNSEANYPSYYLPRKEFKKAIKLAEAGDVESALLVSLNFLFIEKYRDNEQAKFWSRIAAEHGNEKAQFNLGFMLLNDSDLSNDEEGVYWMRKSAEQGTKPAIEQLKKLNQS